MKNMVGVYYSSQDFSLEPPAFFVEREVARQWLRDDAAWSIHHGRDIALNSEMEQEMAGGIDARKLVGDLNRQQSQIMGEPVMRANAERERWAVRMTRSWHRRVALAEHLNSLKRYQALSTQHSAISIQSAGHRGD
jgi:hypothetical protein